MRRRLTLLTVVVTLLTSMPPPPAHATLTAPPRAACGPGSMPEGPDNGLIGAADRESGRSKLGYWCNMRLVGHNDVYPVMSGQMSWYKHCAYVSTGTWATGYDLTLLPLGEQGFSVVDASDPTNPVMTEFVEYPIAGTHEGIHVNAARGILVVPEGTWVPTPYVRTGAAKLAIYSLEPDCAQPTLVTVFDTGAVPQGFHSGTVSADGNTFWGTETITGPCLVGVDISDLDAPKLLGIYRPATPCHDVDVNRDGSRAYVGTIDGTIATGIAGAAPPGLAPNGLEIVDISDFQARLPDPEFRAVSGLDTGRWHTHAVARIGDAVFDFQAQEAGCEAAAPIVVDITDEANPVVASSLAMGFQVDPDCSAKRDDAGDSGLGTHYFGFDSIHDSASDHEPTGVTTAFLTGYESGLRAWDVTDPYHPREIGYFYAPVIEATGQDVDEAFSWVRFIPERSEVWFAGWYSGFNVVRLTNCAGPQPTDPAYVDAWKNGQTC